MEAQYTRDGCARGVGEATPFDLYPSKMRQLGSLAEMLYQSLDAATVIADCH